MTNSLQHGRFLRLFLQHQRQLAGYARAFLPDWDAVDEVLQESSIVMWRKIDQLDSPDGFLKWAKAVVRFESLKHLRQRRTDRLMVDEELVTLLAANTGEDEHGSASELEMLKRCLHKLSDIRRK